MPKISIACASAANQFENVKFLHQRLKMSLVQARTLLAMGAQGPFYSCTLYCNDHVERDKDIRDILEFFQSRSIALFILEIQDEMDWSALDIDNLEWYRISEQLLLNELDSSEGLYE